MSAAERDNLERNLEALRASNPVMPADIERRIREQIAAEAQRPTRVRRPPFPPAGGMSSQLVVLLVLVMVAGWLVTHSVLPVLRANAIGSGGVTVDHCEPSEPAAVIVTAPAVVSRASVTARAKVTPLERCEHPTQETVAPSLSARPSHLTISTQ